MPENDNTFVSRRLLQMIWPAKPVVMGFVGFYFFKKMRFGVCLVFTASKMKEKGGSSPVTWS